MEKISFRELAVPLIKAIDSFNYLLQSHHRRTAIIAFHLGVALKLSHERMVDLVVAASLHDVGALSVQERDTLIQMDVEDPLPHCLMGHKMLSAFDAFKRVAPIIRHHHIHYDEVDQYVEEIPFQSHILHLADRVDIYINPEIFIMNQRQQVVDSIMERLGTVFDPVVCGAFQEVAKTDIFWIEINDLTMNQLFDRIHFPYNFDLNHRQIEQFALVISRIVDFRSRFTATHSATVAHLAGFIGEKFGLDAETCFGLSIAGYFHDIGKIGIDTNYIEKGGPLTDEEYSQVKLHSYYTGVILNELSSFECLKDIVNWSKSHHEKLDGSGYPCSLSAGSIDVETRILAYADVLSALMEDRPYRLGVSADIAFDIIDAQVANKIGRDIFPILLNNKNEIGSVIEKCHLETLKHFDTVDCV